MGVLRTLLRGRLGTDNWDYWLPTITQFKTQPKRCNYFSYICLVMLPATTPWCFISKGKKEQRGKNRKNGRGLPYFEVIILIRSVLASPASFLWYYLLSFDVPAHKVIVSSSSFLRSWLFHTGPHKDGSRSCQAPHPQFFQSSLYISTVLLFILT